MKKVFALAVILISVFTTSLVAQTRGDAILGEWMSAKKDTKFQIFNQNNKYYGKIIWGTGAETKDVKNPDSKIKNREVIGLVMLNNFVFDGDDTWEDGTIYDPREGKTYSCKITLKSANQISVRGFVGISLFGRTEIWTKIK